MLLVAVPAVLFVGDLLLGLSGLPMCRPFRAAESDRLPPLCRCSFDPNKQAEQHPARKLPKQSSALSAIARLVNICRKLLCSNHVVLLSDVECTLEGI